MKFKSKRFPITIFFSRIKFIELILDNIFFLFFFTLRKINRFFSINHGNIVIIALHKLGDTLFTIPAISEIRKQYKQKCIIICYSPSVPIFNLTFEDIEYCVVEREDFYFQERIAKRKVRKRLKFLKPYIIFDLTGWIISASLIFNSRASKIIGINRRQFRSIYDKFVEHRTNPKLVDIYLDAISPVIQTQNVSGLKSKPVSINANGKILLHPFAGWKEKEWNLRSFVSLAKKLNNSYDVGIIIQNNFISTDIYQEIFYSQIDLIQTSSSEELIQAIKVCSFFIGNDSGPINIANYLGKPTFTIFGSTNHDYVASDSDFQNYTQLILQCSARENEKYCIIGTDIYSCPGIQCMNLLTVDEVYEDVIPLINKYSNRKNHDIK